MAFEDMVSFKSKIGACVTGIDSWMIINKLKMDSDKTEILVFSSSHRPRPALDLLDIVQRMCVTQVLQGILGLFLVILYLWHLVSRLCASLPFFIA